MTRGEAESSEDTRAITRIGVELRQIRWRLRRGSARLRRGREALESSPILFGNSFPKSGTHLLAQILEAFPRIGLAVDRGMGPILTFERATGRQRPLGQIVGELSDLRPGDIGFGHIIAGPETTRLLCRERIVHYFVLRDPRDVVVSHAHYLGERAVHNVHYEYYRSLPDLGARIRASILGRPDWEDGSFPDIRSRFALYQGWLSCPWVCVLHYETFVEDRAAALTRVLDASLERGFHLRLARAEALESLADAIDPTSSYTFRHGSVGDWREHFTPEHVRLLKETAGDLLIDLGYESDLDW
jgi:hypothetical protein